MKHSSILQLAMSMFIGFVIMNGILIFFPRVLIYPLTWIGLNLTSDPLRVRATLEATVHYGVQFETLIGAILFGVLINRILHRFCRKVPRNDS